MIKKFAIRWLVCLIGLWLSVELLGTDTISMQNKLSVALGSSFVLAVVNMLIKPLLVFLSLPAVLLSLGLFMIIINGVTVWLAAWLYGPLEVSNFGAAILAGMVIGLVNLLVSAIVEEK